MPYSGEVLNEETRNNNTKRNFPFIFLYATGGTAAAITLISIPFISPALRRKCLPYVPATSAQITNVLSALENRSGKLVDIGSGDGRIVHAAATNGFEAVGVELNIWLVLYSRFVSFKKGLSQNTKFYRKNLWLFDLKPYPNVVLFGTEDMMHDIEKKFVKELKHGSTIVTCRFPLPNLKAIEMIGDGIDTVWKYKVDKMD